MKTYKCYIGEVILKANSEDEARELAAEHFYELVAIDYIENSIVVEEINNV